MKKFLLIQDAWNDIRPTQEQVDNYLKTNPDYCLSSGYIGQWRMLPYVGSTCFHCPPIFISVEVNNGSSV